MSVNSLASLGGYCISGVSTLSESTKRKLQALGIDPSSVTSEAQAQSLINAAQTRQQVQKANIPANIDKIWDDTPLYTPKKEQQPAVINEERQVPIPLTSTPVDYARRITEPAPKIIKQPLPVQQKPKTIVETPNIVQQSKPAPPVTFEQPKPVYNPNSPVMQKYKGSLRSALFSKFAAGSVQGAGTCEIQFSVDETGKLTNRKFLKESGNKSLDDAVYYMLMSVPKFTPPPDEYNGEPIRMKFIMNYGNYEISIN